MFVVFLLPFYSAPFTFQAMGPWKPVSRAALIAWLLFYAAFLLHAVTSTSHFLVIDFVNLVVHEGGHLLFSYLGETMTVWGGTLLQWLVPLLLAIYFFSQRHTTAFVFSLFFFFENWLYTAVYMADARAQALPLVSVGGGDGDPGEHDWFNIFSRMGVLEHDTAIAAWVRFGGWLGMLSVLAWFTWQGLCGEEADVLRPTQG